MSDLISRSAAIEQMWWLYNNYVNNANNFEQEETEAINRAFSRLQKVFEDLPIAYDKEAVVEQLEEKTEFLKDCTKYGNKNAKQQEQSYSTMMMYEVADLVDELIDTIKAGGIDG